MSTTPTFPAIWIDKSSSYSKYDTTTDTYFLISCVLPLRAPMATCDPYLSVNIRPQHFTRASDLNKKRLSFNITNGISVTLIN